MLSLSRKKEKGTAAITCTDLKKRFSSSQGWTRLSRVSAAVGVTEKLSELNAATYRPLSTCSHVHFSLSSLTCQSHVTWVLYVATHLQRSSAPQEAHSLLFLSC